MRRLWKNVWSFAQNHFNGLRSTCSRLSTVRTMATLGGTGGLVYGSTWLPSWLSGWSPQGTSSAMNSTIPVYAWGDNSHGLVAPDSSDTIIKYPRKMSELEGLYLASVSVGPNHAAAIDQDGNLYQWGRQFKPLGESVENEKCTRPVPTLSGHQLDQVICTEHVVLAFSQSQQQLIAIDLYRPPQSTTSSASASASASSSSSSPSPALNHQTNLGHRIIPIPFQEELPRGERAQKIAAGHDHFIIMGEKGTVLSGSLTMSGNLFGQLGRGPTTLTKRAEFYQRQQVKKPPTLEKFMSVFWGRELKGERKKVQDNSNSRNNNGNSNEDAAIIDKDEQQLIESSELDPGLTENFQVKAVPIPVNAQDIACGNHHTLVLGRNGRVYAFGSNELQQLGLGHSGENRVLPIVATPREVSSLEGVTAIAAGSHTSYFIINGSEKTEIYAAGAGLYGQLGNGTWTHAQGQPTLLPTLSHLYYYDEREGNQQPGIGTRKPIKCRGLMAGGDHAAAIMSTYRANTSKNYGQTAIKSSSSSNPPRHGDDLYIWGGNRYYQLGLGGKHHNQAKPTTPVPLAVDSRTSATDALQLSSLLEAIKGTKNEPSNTNKNQSSSLTLSKSDQQLKLKGPLLMNPEETITFTGGQLQLLTRLDNSQEEETPIHRIYCGPNVTILY